MELKNKTAIITGGASGLGEATARRFLKFGANVVIFDMNEERGLALCSELGTNIKFIKTDVTSPDSVAAAVDFAVQSFGQVDILVNCAGFGTGIKTVSKKGPHDLDAFKKAIDLNLTGTFDVIRNTAFRMINNNPNEDGERGVIINTSSVASIEGQVGQVAYAASKAGVNGMTIVLARDLAGDGIRVCTIAPGTFKTPLLETLSEEVQASLGRAVPFPSRLGKPDEYAMLAQQIVENSMLNGEIIRLDGAIRMPPR